jgi:hypothetical protein
MSMGFPSPEEHAAENVPGAAQKDIHAIARTDCDGGPEPPR